RRKARERLRRHRGMRTPDAAVALKIAADTRACRLIVDRYRADRAAQPGGVRKQGREALQIARIAHVHRRWQRGDARSGLQQTLFDEIRYGTVGIVRQDDLIDRCSEPASPDA